MINLDLDDPYLKYYTSQAGRGVNNVYRGTEYQRGHGIGSFLGGLFRSVTPLLKSGAKALGREALRSGLGLVGDLAYMPPQEAVKNRVKELTGNLKRRADGKIDRIMKGSGYKRQRVSVTPQSIAKLLNSKTNRKRSKRVKKKASKKKRKVSKKKKKVTRRKSTKKIRKTTNRDIFN